MSQLRELCEKDGGMPVYQEVKAKGYFNTWVKSCGCWDYLTHDGYEFMEFDIRNAGPSDQLPDPGLWRISIVPTNSGLCSDLFNKALIIKRGSKGFDDFLESRCIKAEKISEAGSRYVYESSSNRRVVSDYYGSTIARIEEILIDKEKENVVVRKVDYLLNPFPRSSLAYGRVYSCTHVLDDPGFKKVIAPKN